MEKWADNEIIYDGKIIKVRVGDVTLDDGSQALREVVEHNGGVCAIPFTGDSVILIRQFRIAIGQNILEAPAGKIEGDEEPEYRGRCEVEEETGYRPGRMVSLGYHFPTVGYCSEKIHLFLAFDLKKTEQKLDPDERIEIVEMPLEQVRKDLKANAFIDGKTALGLWALLHYLDSENGME